MAIDAQAALAALDTSAQTMRTVVAEQAASLNALSLQVDSLSAANVALQAQVAERDQTIAELKAKIPAPAPELTWAQKYGVYGDGVHDDTLAIQKAIDAGEGRVPAGRYLIDPLRVASGTSTYGLLVGSGKRLEMDPNAVLVLKPNAAPRYCGVRVDGGTMVGGQILGDRLQHTFTAGSTHEWGYGFQCRGTGSRVSNVRVSNCTGDGVGVSGADVELRGVVSTQNRRQGISIFAIKGLRVYDSEFSKTGALNGQPGTNPRCGVDIEPDSGWAEDVLFENCTITDNEVTGFVAWIRAEVVGGVRNLTLRNNKITGVNALHMKALAGSITASLFGNTIKRGNGSGIRLESGVSLTIGSDAEPNTFQQPTDRTDFSLVGMDSRTKYDIAVLTGATAPKVGKNTFV